jgi:translation initiation factor IF-2
MAKIRVYQLARELNRDNSEVIRELQHLGAPVTSHSNTVEDRMAEQLRQTLGVLVVEKPKSKTKEKATKAVKKKPLGVTAEPKLVKAKPKPPVPEPTPAPETPEQPEKAPESPAQPTAPTVVPPAPETRTVQPAPVQQETKPPVTDAPPKPRPAAAGRAGEERKTMQQLAQERLRQQNRPVPTTTARRPSPTRDPRAVGRTAPPRPRGPEPPRRDVRRDRPRPTRAQRVERTMGRRPMPRPQPKPEPVREFRKITLTENPTVKDIAEKLDARSKDVIKKLMDRGMLATINQTLDKDLAQQICKDFNAEAEFVTFEESVLLEAVDVSEPSKMKDRPPVVTIMGHVDHGKTSLLDAIRETHVTSQEHGGITQHIGAYQVTTHGRKITFLDTPGHEAFTLMRARGASVTDVVILVVAADDGVMPQTLESISHTRAANVPLLVAINKIDVPNANVDKVKRELAEKDLLAEDWGGDTVMVEVSAKQKTNLDLLLEMVLLVADMRQLKADPDFPAMGTVLEAKLDKGRGNVATVLVQNGTLRVGDNFIAGAVYGKVRAMYDEHGKSVDTAGPSVPTEVLGLQGLPGAGDSFQVITDDTKARQISQFRQEQLRETALAKKSRLTLDQLHLRMEKGEVKEVPIVLKGDVQGSTEVLTEMLNKLETAKVKVRIIHAAVGAITEYDVLLAATSNAIIVGFNVRPEKKASEIAARENVDIRLHTVIYNVVDEMKQAMAGVLEPITKENYLGTAEVRDTFRVPKIGTIAGCYITDGRITRNAQVRLLRDNVVIYEGKIASLKRFKEDASEVRSGYECGIGLQNYNDVKVGDVIEAFVTEQVAAEIGV